MNNNDERNGGFWEKAFNRYSGPLCSRARRVLTGGNAESAEDAVSEAFYRAILYAKEPETIANLFGYLWVIVKRVWFAKVLPESSVVMVRLDDLTEGEQPLSVVPSAEQEVLRKELSDWLIANRGLLNPREEVLFRLFYVEGYTPTEIAAELKEDMRLTRVDLNALKAKLRYRLQRAMAKTKRQGRP